MAELAYDTGGQNSVKRCLASWLYEALNNCRNDFLHGNPVEVDDLKLPGSGRLLFEYAAPLYRLALTAFLPIAFDREIPSETDVDELGAYAAARIEFLRPQRQIERAILTAKQARPTK